MKHATFGRFISVLLAFVMVIGEVPVYASADVPLAGEIRAIEDNGNISIPEEDAAILTDEPAGSGLV